jgi:transcriptional regulator GlxA family with amidase domain
MDESAMLTRAPATIAILAVPEASASVIYGMYDLFRSAGRDWNLIVDGAPGPELLRPLVVARQPGSFAAGNGVRITPDCTLEACPPPDIVCVPEVLVAPDVPPVGQFEVEARWLRACHERGAIIAAACSGALLLAEAGLLQGADATTHWAYCDMLQRHYPDVRVREQAALVASGEGQRLVMAGGGTSWLDLALYLVARVTSVEVAMQTARVFLIDWHDIGQQPFARLARSRQVDDAVIARCQVWIAEHYAGPAPVAAMVRLSGLAERTFKRRFQLATGLAPLEYVHTVRLEEAKQMLEAGTAPVESIAREVGYEDAGFFNRLFRRKVGLTPAQYRKRFGALRQRLASC